MGSLTASIEGRVIRDVDGNGLIDPEDTNGLAGVVVVLSDTNGMPLATNTTDGTGDYSFTNLPTGDYVVTETDPAGFFSTEDTDGGNDNAIAVSILCGLDVLGNHFLDAELGSIAGAVLADEIGNGLFDPEDTNGLAGVTVILTDTNSSPLATNLTDVAGDYIFSNLLPGVYVVVETDPAGFFSTTDRDGTNDNQITLTVTSEDHLAGNDFLDAAPGFIRGSVLVDINGDGLFDPEDTNGVGGVTIVLTDTNDMPLATNFTDAAGAYAFSNVAPGFYAVHETDRLGFFSTGDRDGSNDNRVATVLLSGGDAAGNDFLDTLPGAIGGLVRNDINGDGVLDPEDTEGLAGVEIVLADTNGLPIATNLTDAAGNFAFFSVIPGTYLLFETDPAGFFSTGDSDGTNDNTIFVTLFAGAASGGHEFLDAAPGGIEGSVLIDEPVNGVFDPVDTNGIPGVVMVLTDTNGIPIATNLTDTAGAYSFTNLAPGDYVVEETDPAGFFSTGDTDGGLDNQVALSVFSGTTATNISFLDAELGRIGGQVRFDGDADGDFGDPDPPLVNVRVELWSDPNIDGSPLDGSLLASTQTGTNGVYLFTGLNDDAYVIVEVDPTNYLSTADSLLPNNNWIPVSLPPGGDLTNNVFLDDLDPTGYVYPCR
ncbi:MAG: SdrD B-like domain-containing protein [Verrucomicrobiota bacterium]